MTLLLPEVVPVPVRLTVCGLPLALSFTDRVPLCVPLLCGANVTEIVQLAPAAGSLPQLLVSVNAGLEIAMLDMASVAD